MPLYEYQCDECQRRFELIQKHSDPRIETCPTCSGHVTRLFSSPAIHFKGSGWYITDYARAGKNEGEKGEKAAKSEGGKSDKSDPSGKADTSDKSEGGKGSSSKSDAAPAAGGSESAKSEAKGESSKSDSAPASTGTAPKPAS